MIDPNGLRADLKEAYRADAGPPVDEVDEAMAIVRRAREILADPDMKAAIMRRLQENRQAMQKAGATEGMSE